MNLVGNSSRPREAIPLSISWLPDWLKWLRAPAGKIQFIMILFRQGIMNVSGVAVE